MGDTQVYKDNIAQNDHLSLVTGSEEKYLSHQIIISSYNLVMSFYPKRRSIRLPGYDYTQPGGYFVTLLAHNRASIFGRIVDYSVQLSALGMILENEWLHLPHRFSHVELDAYVVMPNHFHGIILLNEHKSDQSQVSREELEGFGQPVAGSIPTIIRSFKSSVTLKVRLTRGFPSDMIIWHRNYYEHVIRTPTALDQIRIYIQGNPALWEQDEHNLRL